MCPNILVRPLKLQFSFIFVYFTTAEMMQVSNNVSKISPDDVDGAVFAVVQCARGGRNGGVPGKNGMEKKERKK